MFRVLELRFACWSGLKHLNHYVANDQGTSLICYSNQTRTFFQVLTIMGNMFVQKKPFILRSNDRIKLHCA